MKWLNLIPSIRRDGVEIEASKDFKVEVFPPFMNNIILNMVKNAQKHGNAKKVTLSWDAATRRLYIKDNGSGIPETMREKVFHPNFTTKSSGTGLGLAMSRNIIDQAKGRIYFNTIIDKGTDFYVELPMLEVLEEVAVES